MSNWSDGYISEVDYTYGYYAELNPTRAELAFLSSGYEFPSIGNACELGYGQGISINLHAAGNALINWYGTDFMPGQASHAQSLAKAAGTSAKLTDEPFSEFCTRQDLPQFDFIGVHGIWSWISDENREIITRFISKKLAVGGVLYISYNTLPGWSSTAPLRHLMTEHAENMTSPGQGIVNCVDAALQFTHELIKLDPNYTLANPLVSKSFEKIRLQNRNYLAHEYFNQNWNSIYFSDMKRWLETAKMSFVCSSTYLEHIDPLNLSEDQRRFIDAIPNPDLKETVRDFMINQQFRRDFWVKGPRKLSPLRQLELLRSHRVIMTTPSVDIPLKAKGSRAEVVLQEKIYSPIIRRLSDHKIHQLSELEIELKSNGVSFGQLVQALIMLIGLGHVYSAQDDIKIRSSLKYCQKINQEIMIRSRSSDDYDYLVSPVTGGGLRFARFPQLFLLAIQQGKKQPSEWAQFAMDILIALGQNITKDGKTLSKPEDNLAELTNLASAFATKQLPIAKALQIV